MFCRLGGGETTAWFDEVSLQEARPDQAPILRTAVLDAAYDNIEQQWLTRDLPPYRPPEIGAAAVLGEYIESGFLTPQARE